VGDLAEHCRVPIPQSSVAEGSTRASVTASIGAKVLIHSDCSQKRLVIKSRNQGRPEFKAEGYSNFVYEIRPIGASVKLAVTHSFERPDSPFIAAVFYAWPWSCPISSRFVKPPEVALIDRPRNTN
jgi:hypothetical protein